jgi:hypothetical protein
MSAKDLWLLKNSIGGNPQKNDRVSLATGSHVVCCCDKNVMVLCSERLSFDQNRSICSICKQLENHVE